MAGCGGRISRAPNYFTVLPSSSPSGGGGVAEEDLPAMPVWKTYLYQLQLQAPKSKRIVCTREVPNRPPHYGREFHGAISREDADRLMCKGDGCYLIRESQRAPGAYTLAIRFEGVVKNFKLYYDGKHYVGEKRFDTVQDLVADGLITFYLESKAADYIATLSSQSNYEESPYIAYASQKKKRLTASSSRESTASSSISSISEGKVSIDDPRPPMSQDVPDWKRRSLAIEVMQYEKQHVFKVHTFKGFHWCDFCANFLWGLVAQGVKCQDCGFNFHKKCSEKVLNDCIPDMKHVKRVFGVDLTTLVKAQNTTIPAVVEKCVKEIESRPKGLETEGLYRVAGFHDDVEAIRMAFDKDGDDADISETKYEDINTIASLLKLYFRMLPIPLITFDTYNKFMAAVKGEGITEKQQLEIIKEALQLLAPAHYVTLQFLMKHLSRVTEYQHKNMMNPENLAIVFAPTLLRSPENDPLLSLTAVKFERELIELFIMYYKLLFET